MKSDETAERLDKKANWRASKQLDDCLTDQPNRHNLYTGIYCSLLITQVGFVMVVLFLTYVYYSFADFNRFQQVFTQFCQCEESNGQVDAQTAFSTLGNIVVCSVVSVHANFVVR